MSSSAVDALNALELDEKKFLSLLGDLIGESKDLQNTGVGTAHVPKEDLAVKHVLEALKPYRVESGGVLEVEHAVVRGGTRERRHQISGERPERERGASTHVRGVAHGRCSGESGGVERGSV